MRYWILIKQESAKTKYQIVGSSEVNPKFGNLTWSVHDEIFPSLDKAEQAVKEME